MNGLDRPLIADVDAERAVLGACIASPKVALEVAEILAGPDDFLREQHRTMFWALVELATMEKPTDLISLRDHLQASGRLGDAGGIRYLVEVNESLVAVGQATHHAGIVAKLAERRRAVQAAMRLLQKLENPERETGDALEEFAADVSRARHPDARPGGRIRLTPASQIQPRPVVWAWEDDGHGRIPAGSLISAAGREGTGKSSFGIWLASEITRGTLPGTLYGQPRQVVYVAVEDSWSHTLVPRLIAAGADLDRVYRAEAVVDEGETTTLSLPHDLAELESVITKHGVGLVVLDPLMSTIGGTIDTHRERDVRKALDPLARLADRTSAVVLGIAHFNKGTGTDASSLITGSGAFKNVPRAIFGFACDPDDGTRVMTQTKNSLGIGDLPSLAYRIVSAKVETTEGTAEVGRFVFDGQSDRSVAQILGDRTDPDERSERDEAAAWLDEYITAQGEAPANDVMKAGTAAGFSKDTLKRAKNRAGVESRKAAFGSGWVWAKVHTEGSTKGAKGA
ncbi:AAA family ATPase [Actinomadura sp. WAC 06369]|uniref:AAA family ATPase n=1 Tax=Actinomadura sp. WAC 06369 TaxID=2203193 RepID=UPI0013150583|nr:AAA family ATPase [Actinomadura sp. WAC 06369]